MEKQLIVNMGERVIDSGVTINNRWGGRISITLVMKETVVVGVKEVELSAQPISYTTLQIKYHLESIIGGLISKA